MSSYGHRARRIAEDHYRVSWTVDFHYPTSRLRFPRVFARDTDRAGAERFAKRWKIVIKEPAPPIPVRPPGKRRR